MSEYKEYLGNAVYASFDGYQIWLKTSDGMRILNEIALEPSVFHALVDYERRLRILLLSSEAKGPSR